MPIDTNISALIYRRTKIIATMGPASWDEPRISALIQAGVNVFRLNMSHGDYKSHQTSFERIRAASARLNKPVAILADLCGPKIRVGKFVYGPIQLKRDDEVVLTTREVLGSATLIPSQYLSLHEEVKVGHRILLADGLLELHPHHIEGQNIYCRVIRGGALSDHKGMNLPDTPLTTPALTEKDRADALFALGLGVDFLALSFVRSADDVADLRSYIAEAGFASAIIAKIERNEALTNIDAILEQADGIMIARGDLGVELPAEQVPIVQKQLIQLARLAHKPVIVATQMLESMVEHSQPTRAEVADVAGAVSSGVDAIMLSAETASGDFPVEAVLLMDKVARRTEAYQWHTSAKAGFALDTSITPPLSHAHALARATTDLSHDLMVHAIVVVSSTGASTSAVSSARPSAPIVAVTSNTQTYRRMCLLWGVLPDWSDDINMDELMMLARQHVRQLAMGQEGDNILLIRGFHIDVELSAPSITILHI